MKNDGARLIAAKIHESRRIAVTSHLRPDGDSICTALAFYEMGRLLGKEVELINKDRIPFPFHDVPEIDRIRIGSIPPDGFDIVILLECANVPRSGQEDIEAYFKINIDHHHSNDYYADINWVNPQAAAVGCMGYVLGMELGVTITPQIANHLYCAIVSDTGSFQFSNTGAEAFEICSRLVGCGADPPFVSDFLYNRNSPQKIMLLGEVLSTLKMNDRGNIAVVTMFRKFLDRFEQKEIDTEDITTLVRSIKGLEMVLFFKEIGDNTYRVSLRSKGGANSALVAEHFGGGGHVHAAGFTITGRHADLIKNIPAQVSRILDDLQQTGIPGKTRS